ncbi:MAG: sensor domain-containing diguanylate cyclase [Candidatus Omnitrophica bacterium]|nr:sensor domain-containing diguanylate cyclase [Candidatus Omnitrophota bacterium]MDD5354979.1 sensor domain-containing diguanylate cyclase [Candidatus Omnitrophota bacterium]
MLILILMQESKHIQELNKAKAELSILYEVSNAMHTTLKLDEILYIILTGVTAHIGLGFNRAMLFLVNRNLGVLEGKMGIGPDTTEEADFIWKGIDTRKTGLKDLIGCYSKEKMMKSKFNRIIESVSISYNDNNILSLAVRNDSPYIHATKDKIANLGGDPLLKFFDSKEFVIVPLRAKDDVVGLIIVDNFVTNKTITDDDIRMLTMFANHAALAIENSQLYEQTLIKAHTDSLTGLWNHGYFQQVTDQLLDNSNKGNDSLSLFLIDIDNFKIFNDTYGHQQGDNALVSIANIFKEASRKLDCVCRYGGEEFAIVLPKTNIKDALVIAERIRSAIDKYDFDVGMGQPLRKITVSIGVATFPNHADNKSELIKAADKALYEAKNSGKDKVVIFPHQ